MSVFETFFSFLMHSIVHFSHFVFKCRKHNYFCCDFLLGLLILNISFVANFEFEYFWINSSGLLHVLRGLNQLHSILSCIFRVFSVITNRNLYGLIVAHVIGRYLTFQFKSKKKTCIQKVSWLVDYEKTKYQLQKDTKSFIVCVSKIYSKRTNSGTRSSSLYCLLTDSSLVIAPRLRDSLASSGLNARTYGFRSEVGCSLYIEIYITEIHNNFGDEHCIFHWHDIITPCRNLIGPSLTPP